MQEKAEVTKLPHYGGTIFISYARADDHVPPDKQGQGWVSYFWGQLRWALTNAGLHDAKLWLDRYEIEKAEDFTARIEQALREAQLIVPVLSTNWIQRRYCQRELDFFSELRAGRGDDVVTVYKQEPPIVPEICRQREGFRFFEREQTGRVRDFYWRGLEDEKAYFDTLKQIVDWIAGRLISTAVVAPTVQKRRTIYLAAPADELRDAWQRLANDLDASGFNILPAAGRLPDTVVNAEAAIRSALATAELSVHFLGESEGAIPAGGTETYQRLQLRLARAMATGRPGFQRILWAPKWLSADRAVRRDPFEVVQRFGSLGDNEHVFGEEVTDLSQWVRRRLVPPPTEASPTGQVRLLVAAASEADADLPGLLASRLPPDAAEVLPPLFPGDPLPEAVPGGKPVVLLPWAEAPREVLDTLLTGLLPLAKRIIVLRLPGGNPSEKLRFYREGVEVERVEQLPSSPAVARGLLAQLDIVPAPQ